MVIWNQRNTDEFTRGVLARLAHDTSGNTLALIAASIFPLLAMIGGGVDMGRTYLTQSRLQQACDAGVLAARKKLGSGIPTGMPADVENAGNRFFNLNFNDGAYGTNNRNFAMSLQPDMAIDGLASVDVPTTIMQIFGYKKLAVNVTCTARLNFANTDVMFVLDTTGSMADTNPGDSKPKIDVLKDVVRSFHSSLESNKAPGTRLRYGFLPYSTNVNVGQLLKSDWMVDKWTYQSRTPRNNDSWTTSYYSVEYTVISGSATPIEPFKSATCPASTKQTTYSPKTVISTTPDDYYYDSTSTGSSYYCDPDDGGYTVSGITFNNYVERAHWKWAYDGTYYVFDYLYRPLEYDVSSLKGPSGSDNWRGGPLSVQINGDSSTGATRTDTTWVNGCIEERDTYEITDYSNVDLSRALDLDIDLVPKAGDPKTQWHPQIPGVEFLRFLQISGGGSFQKAPGYHDYNVLNAGWNGLAACPTQAMRLAELSQTDFDNYLNSLVPKGDTYHDIGMIWGGRMLSPTGIFAADNADVPGKPTARHLIFLTDGKTEAYDVDYSAYGIEPLDERRWTSKSTLSLNDVVEKRFGVACNEVKKRNITVWVIGFGTTLNPIMKQCAGPGHYFEAKDATTLSDTFAKIAQQLGDLRLSK
ncbi:MAG: hypothetical protein KGM18_02465 [Sphingomonadales bacterium]|nr:hypothetical protein [Sphingomonadales bacterium]